MLTLDDLTDRYDIMVDGIPQPNLAAILWQRHFITCKDAAQASAMADEHLSKLLGHKVNYFTVDMLDCCVRYSLHQLTTKRQSCIQQSAS